MLPCRKLASTPVSASPAKARAYKPRWVRAWSGRRPSTAVKACSRVSSTSDTDQAWPASCLMKSTSHWRSAG
ncbi:hypothetical protein WR25_09615 [Diploscapter pachys]|uniref:Uncharacterized protein n=1 Tax=Diploscapter pachys TaxID=2018661 RepID=A0A2A2M5F4_9BILA|nr:hypothetical protein WR25_09615 [Diploscapter pachys]